MTRCARCGRKLTTIESIARGLGSECAGSGSGSRPLKNWKRKIINSARFRNGLTISVGNDIILPTDVTENKKQWLIRYGFLLKDGEVSGELLDKILENPEEFFNGGSDSNDEK